jgi:hypothetical protein
VTRNKNDAFQRVSKFYNFVALSVLIQRLWPSEFSSPPFLSTFNFIIAASRWQATAAEPVKTLASILPQCKEENKCMWIGGMNASSSLRNKFFDEFVSNYAAS